MKKPNIFLYYFAALFIIPFLKLKFRVVAKPRAKIQGPFVVIANHQAYYDPLYLSYALYGYRLNFVAGYELLLNSKTRWIAKLFHIIPKFQYQIDLKAIKQMLQVVKSGGNLALFPTGRLSSCGVGFNTTSALVKLLKKLNVPVYFCKIRGAYLSSPKWAKNTRKGRVDVEYFPLLSKEQLQTLDEKYILELLNENLQYNEYEDQMKRMIVYRGQDLAENLEKILYHCPHCHSEFRLTSQGNIVSCNECHYRFTIDEYGLFKENPYFKHPLAWFQYQEALIQQKIIEHQYELHSPVIVKTSNGQQIVQVGVGHISLMDETLIFKGQIEGKETSMILNLKDIPSLPYKAGVNIEVPYQDKVFVYELENGLAAVKWSITVEQLNHKI